VSSSVQPLHRLQNRVQPYDWGSRTVLAEFLGRAAPDGGPEAELWIGAHPSAPSRCLGRGPLDQEIAADPMGTLGTRTGRLPFLLKVLAVDRPLSLQVHPDAGQARRGFAAEEARGIARDAASRSYRDDWPKPELVCALTEFEGLCGFRSPRASAELLRSLNIAELSAVVGLLDDGDLAKATTVLARWPLQTRAELVSAVRAACLERAEPFLRWAVRLAEQYPADPGVIIAMLLNHVVLRPGEALFVPPRVVHAYLGGTAVEIMASSDNVLRAGLTSKHVDVGQLLDVTAFTAAEPARVLPRAGGGEEVFPTPATQFRLSRCRVTPGTEVTIDTPGPSALLVVEGSVAARRDGADEGLTRGEAVFVPYRGGALTLSGEGTVFRAAGGTSHIADGGSVTRA
jgi:mannose-6-phosphate isomerase